MVPFVVVLSHSTIVTSITGTPSLTTTSTSPASWIGRVIILWENLTMYGDFMTQMGEQTILQLRKLFMEGPGSRGMMPLGYH